MQLWTCFVLEWVTGKRLVWVLRDRVGENREKFTLWIYGRDQGKIGERPGSSDTTLFGEYRFFARGCVLRGILDLGV